MTIDVRGIVLGTVRHSDRNDITSIYTRERGRLAVATPAGGGRTARMKRASLMPLSLVEATLSGSAGGEIWRLSHLSLSSPWRDLYSDPVKMSVGMFVAEFLGKLVRDAGPDVRQWDYVVSSLKLLDAESNRLSVANFPVILLSSLAAFAGIMPDVSGWPASRVFDMRAGQYVGGEPGHPDTLRGDAAGAVRLLSRLTFASGSRLRLSRVERQEILGQLLRYYSIHLPGVAGMKSPAILRDVLG